MATNATTWNSALYVERWQKNFAIEAPQARFFEKFVGPTDQDIIQRVPDLENQRGKSVHIDITAQLSADGVTGDGTRAGNEEKISTFEQEVTPDGLWHGTISTGPVNDQKVLYDFRKKSMPLLLDWHKTKKDEELIEAWETSPTRTLGADDGGTPRIDSDSKAGLVDADLTTVADIRLLKTLAKKPATSGNFRIRPYMRNGKPYYLLVLGSESFYDLKNDSEYNQILREAWWRGDSNPIFSDADVIIDGVIIHEFEGISSFENGGGASVHGEINLFLGAQSAVIAMVTDGIDWHEEEVDRNKQMAIGATVIRDIVKTKFNSIDLATIAYYAATTDLSA